ncbi:NlpC/P60 family protein [Blastococcus haudaquaticus]|uniref:Cell wall-associated hydrolase, NlpC family n=1 Tax=Blastococcus haudaquaticus TaxID=1938745 RepID=A0A286H173_9ACTN|nr:NlpC/P60 family protein [Blastococcus haudaquaticus]SOE01206.1 Cell wall-associated hydrolase, NlpC family [Blastococcus haudaquaticus]
MPAPRTSTARPSARPSARPVLSAREAQALREAMALRALAAGQPLTPVQAAALRTATAQRTTPGASRTAPRPPARRPAAKGRTATPGLTRRPTKPRRRAAQRPATRTGSAWPTRLRVVALSTLLLPAVAALVLPGAGDGRRNGSLDDTSLALAAQSSMLEDAGRYRLLEQEVAQRRTELRQAQDAERAARADVEARQATVGVTAAKLYRATPHERYPLLSLSVRDAAMTSGALYGQSLAERADRELTAEIVRAQRSSVALAVAGDRVALAESAVREADDRADAVLAAVRSTVDDLTPEITSVLAGLGAVPVTGPQQERNQQATARWQQYLGQLAAAGIAPPPAADIADPADLPAGFTPALDAAGQPIPGVVWAVIGSSPVTVVSAETAAAVSTALSQLGKPFVPGTTGPDSYDCGGFTAASWLRAGHAVPATPQDQWATGAPVPLDNLQIGDLVYAPGGQDVAIYLGDGEVVGASATTFQVSVRSLTSGSTATRVTLPAPAQPNPPLPVAEAGACGAPLPPAGERTASWGGWSNGQIPGEALCQLGVHRHALRCDAAASYGQLDAAFTAAFGTRLCITDSYRSLASQVSAFARKPKLAAVPGTSNHGWALAVDLCGGINVEGSPQFTWMTANAARFGFVQPDWAAPGGEKPEPWHWEYGYIS